MKLYVVGYYTTHLGLFLHHNEHLETKDWDGCSTDRTPTLFTSRRRAEKLAKERGWSVRTVGKRFLRECTDYQREVVRNAVKRIPGNKEQNQ